MDFYRASVVIHVLGAVGLVGMGLFWFVMATAIERRFDHTEARRLLSIVNQARCPHVIVPYRWRVPLPLVSWALLAVLLLTGGIVGLAVGWPSNASWWVKIGLLFGLCAVQVRLFRRPSRQLVHLNLAMILTIVVLSGLMVR